MKSPLEAEKPAARSESDDDFDDKPKVEPQWKLQLKQELAQMSFSDQESALQPPRPSEGFYPPIMQMPGTDDVQMADGGSTESVHAAAARGVQGGGGALPHADRIQQSFGSHDISGVQAHTGEAAKAAASSMGAEAYATGNKVAFKSQPDLHTAAHEAAHVVQQAQGVSLPGGVGKTGDTYEKHADSVADKVVRGESAEGLLSSGAGGAASLQRKAVQQTAPSASSDRQSSSGSSSSRTAGEERILTALRGLGPWFTSSQATAAGVTAHYRQKWKSEGLLHDHGGGSNLYYSISPNTQDPNNLQRAKDYATSTRWPALTSNDSNWVAGIRGWSASATEPEVDVFTDFSVRSSGNPARDKITLANLPIKPILQRDIEKVFTSGVEGKTLKGEYNPEAAKIVIGDATAHAETKLAASSKILADLKKDIKYDASVGSTGRITMPGEGEVAKDLLEYVPAGTGENAAIFQFMRAMAQSQDHRGIKASNWAALKGSQANKTYLANRVRGAFSGQYGQHEYIPSSLVIEVIDRAKAAVESAGDTDQEKIKAGLAWIELQHSVRSETWKLVFAKNHKTVKESQGRRGPAVDKKVMQGHSGAVKGPRDDSTPVVLVSQTSGQPAFHDAMRKAFRDNTASISSCKTAVLAAINTEVWGGGPDPSIHQECVYETGPSAGQKLKDSSLNHKTECTNEVTAGFNAATAKLQG